MSKKELPTFKYHPDPIATRVFEPLNQVCNCCEELSKYVYTPSIYTTHNIDFLCPWCIKSGKAYEKFEANFTPYLTTTFDSEYAPYTSVPDDVAFEILHKTPGFLGSNDEFWWVHCNDGAEFLGYLGDISPSLFSDENSKDFVTEMRERFEINDEEWNWLINTPDDMHSLRFYIFRCLHCGKIGGYGEFQRV